MQRSFTRTHLARQPFMDFKKAKALLNMGPLRKRLLRDKHIHVGAGPMKPAAPVLDAAAAAADAAAADADAAGFPESNKRKRNSNPGRRQQQPGMQVDFRPACVCALALAPAVGYCRWVAYASCCSITLPEIGISSQV